MGSAGTTASGMQNKGCPFWDHNMILNAMLFRTATGIPWRDFPERHGPWQTAYSRYRRWSRSGLWDKLPGALQRQLDASGNIDRT
jgi:transposase